MGFRSPVRRSNFKGKGTVRCKVQRGSAVSCAQMAEPSEMPFGIWTWVGPVNRALDGDPDGSYAKA